MTAFPEPLTLEALLADPITRLVMRRDDVTLVETVRVLWAARDALEDRRATASSRPRLPWHISQRRPCS